MAFNEKDPQGPWASRAPSTSTRALIYSDKSNLLEENVYKYRLQDVAETQLVPPYL